MPNTEPSFDQLLDTAMESQGVNVDLDSDSPVDDSIEENTVNGDSVQADDQTQQQSFSVSNYEDQLREVRAENEALNRVLGHYRESGTNHNLNTGKTDQSKQEDPVPDKEEEPISYLQNKVDRVSDELGNLSTHISEEQKRSQIQNYINDLSGYIQDTTNMVTDPSSQYHIPDYEDAMNHLHDKMFNQWKINNPDRSNSEIQNLYNRWYAGFVQKHRSIGNFLPNVLYNWSLDLGFVRKEKDPNAQENNTEQTEEEKVLAFRGRTTGQVPDLPQSGKSNSKTRQVKSNKDLVDLNEREFKEWFNATGGLNQALDFIKNSGSSE